MREDREYYESLWRQSNAGGLLKVAMLVIAAIITIAFLAGCKTKYVTVPEYHETYVSRTDTVWKTDSVKDVQISIIQEVDSAYLHKIGIINPPEKAYLIQNSQNKEVSKSLIEHTTDTILKVDSVPKIIIKEKELSKWQHLKMDAGVAAMCIAVALLLLFLLKLLIRK
ncbi:MAG: hypothetical protein IKO37_01835 [Prevotella sp.]|nr:hypothetical protein [Prevotella sp.]